MSVPIPFSDNAASEQSSTPSARQRQTAPPAALQIDDLSFGYSGKAVLQEVSLRLEEGQFMVLLGANGAGKTTLFSLITRLYEHRQGEISIGGYALRHHPVLAQARMGVVFQQPTLDLDLTVKQNLTYHGALHGMSRRTALRHAEEQLRRVGMIESLTARVRHLSGGQRRRVEIARGLLHKPRLLLLDEPTVGLDIASRRALVEHVHRLCADGDVAVLWATHLIDEVYPDDRVVVLDRGCIRADGSVAEITAQTHTGSIGDAFDRLSGAEAP